MDGCLRVILSQVVNAIYALFGGWMLMLAVGVAHANWLTTLPTVGYWTAVLLVFLLQGSFKCITSDDLKTTRR